MSIENFTLAIIGGGSVATSFLRQFASLIASKRPYVSGKVYVFEPRSEVGAGCAYQEDSISNLLNTRAGSMSPIASDPSHFIQWLRNNEEKWRKSFPTAQLVAESFLPRALFGIYLQEVHRESVAMLAREGTLVEHITLTVSGIRRVNSGYEIYTNTGLNFQANSAILAIGNIETTAFDHLAGYAGYFNSPYPCKRFAQAIDPLKSVCILGSSLSAIDAAVSLADLGHKGKLDFVSRNGRLPSVRGEHNSPRQLSILSRAKIGEFALANQGRLSLSEIVEFLRLELELCDGKAPVLNEILRDGLGPQRYIDLEIDDASANDRTWQAVTYGLNESIDLIWKSLSVDDKRVFQRQFRSLWLAYRVSFPIQNARKLQPLLHSNQLTVHGGCSEVCFDEAVGRFRVNLVDQNGAPSATIFSEYLINATGYTSDVQSCRSPLIRGMLANGLVRPNEFGGLDVDFDTGCILSRVGSPMKGLFALGSLTAGTYFWTNAMSVNARLAACVAGTIHDWLANHEGSVQDLAKEIQISSRCGNFSKKLDEETSVDPPINGSPVEADPIPQPS